MKRTISLLLSLVIALSLFGTAVPAVSAASGMKTSEQCVAVIKSFEGFAEEPYEDNGNWSVGYGTGVSGEALKNYQQNGITEEEADKLMREYLVRFEESVNKFIDKHDLKLSQNQFDALICFTYNLGPSWMNNTGYTLTQAVINGAKGNDLIFALAQWCKASGSVLKSLINRRLCEANMYLNNVYSTTAPIHYKYVIFETGDEYALPSVSVQGYDSTMTSDVKSSVSRTGYDFLGWYTAQEGGTAVTQLSSKTTVNKLYAHWQTAGGQKDEAGNLIGVKAEYVCYAATEASQKVYDVPGGEQTGTLKGTDKLNIVAEHLDSAGNKWGKIKDGGWINVSAGIDSTPVVEDPGSRIDPITVTVITSNVNNRTGPGTNYPKQGTFTKGQQLTITAVQQGGKYLWGKSEIGWICLDYTDYENVIKEESGEGDKITAIGTIIKADVLNVRSGPGTHNPKVGTYKRGDVVQITLRQKVGNTTWGLTEKGWISLYYVKVTEINDGQTPGTDVPGGETGGTTTPEAPSTPETPSNKVIGTGTVYNCNMLRVRAGAGTGYAHIGNYYKGDQVKIYETVLAGSDTWGRTDKGWICLRYVKMDAPSSGKGVTGRIYNCDAVNVRAGAGTNFAKIGKLTKGTKVEILEYTKVGKTTWCRTYQGWIHLHYIRLDAPLSTLDKVVETEPTVPDATEPTVPDVTEPTVPDTTEPTVPDATEPTQPDPTVPDATEPTEPDTTDPTEPDSGEDEGEVVYLTFKATVKVDTTLKIRSGPGTSNAVVGTYKNGDRITVDGLMLIGETTWGHTDKGWISLYYVVPDGTTNDSRFVVKTANANGKCYADVSTSSEVLASFYKHNLLIVTAETVTFDGKVWRLSLDGWVLDKYLS